MCGAGAQFKAGGDVEKHSGAIGGSVEKQGGAIDGGGWMALGSEVGAFSLLVGTPERVELGFRRRVCQVPHCDADERFGTVCRLKRRCSLLFRLLLCPNDC